jgi:unsaturated rhamnogalacturonyl hydrolase
VNSGDQNQRGAWRTLALGVLSIALGVMGVWGSRGSAQASVGRGKTVMVDAWFNSQHRPDPQGHMVYFHYKWDDTTNTGFSLLAQIFHEFGAATDTLYSAPTLEKLNAAQVYIIASPDIPSKNQHPHYVQAADAQQVAEWVKQGGVLVLMDNDPANADIDHLNLLAGRFGIHFDEVLSHHVVGKDIESGRILVNGGGPVFHHPHTLYMKDTCTISVTKPAVALLTDKEQIVMATAEYGKGTVFAVVDPWLYNEYTNGRNIPAEYDNYAAGEEWARWLLEQVSADRQK